MNQSMLASANDVSQRACIRVSLSRIAYFVLKVHDIEDLCDFGKSQKACPYFAARHYSGVKFFLWSICTAHVPM